MVTWTGKTENEKPTEYIAGKTRQAKTTTVGGKSIYWDNVAPKDEAIQPQVLKTNEIDQHTVRETLAYPEGTELVGAGNLKLNLVLYKPFLEMKTKSASSLNALELVPKIVMPFLVMIFCCFLTRPNSQQALDRYYAKMKTPVDPDPEKDKAKLAAAYADPGNTERVKLFPNSNLEFQKPTVSDIVGFVLSLITCFAIIGFAFWMASIGLR